MPLKFSYTGYFDVWYTTRYVLQWRLLCMQFHLPIGYSCSFKSYSYHDHSGLIGMDVVPIGWVRCIILSKCISWLRKILKAGVYSG